MSSVKLILSDLHLADGLSVFDGFGDAQQSALEGLLDTIKVNDAISNFANVELIINGDCFDFLGIAPYDTNGITDPTTALAKLEKIITAHCPFFKALRSFVDTAGYSVTFIAGNHDIELCFEQVRQRLQQAIGGSLERVNFCMERFYRPLPDVYIEHGNRYDFWNHCGILDEGVINRLPAVGTITLPPGSCYLQHAAYPISISYPYFDHFQPSLNTTHQVALLCLLNPDIVVETAQRIIELLSFPRKALASNSEEQQYEAGERQNPAKLFEQAMLDFAVFQQDMMAQDLDWKPLVGQDAAKLEAAALTEFETLRQALARVPGRGNMALEVEAVAAICSPTVYAMEEDVARGMKHVLHTDPALHYAIAGHTHMTRIDAMNNGTQVYCNTGTWTKRLALPTPDQVTPTLVEWLRQPDWNAIPLRDVTQFTFVLVESEAGGPTNAKMCVWEEGSYHVLV